MNCMHKDKVNKILEWNLLHDILKPSKNNKNINIHYSPILHGCMNTRNGREKINIFWVLLDSGCSSTILMISLIEKLNPKKNDVTQRHMQAVNVITNLKIKFF